jgi:predicted TIM-barrel fold metal-dependent hydrolase
MIIDAHIHLWNRLHGEETGTDREALGWGKAREGDRVYYATPPAFEDSLSTWERAVAHMDWLGIDRAVVLQEFMDGGQDAYLAEVRRRCPERFSCMSLFDAETLQHPIEHFQKAIDERRLQGFLIKTPDPFPHLVTDELLPLWQMCAERGLPLVLKNGAPEEIVRLLDRVPELKVVFSHCAGSHGSEEDFLARLRLAASCPTAYIDTGGMAYRHRYPFAVPQQQLRTAVEIAGADKISWGSDYPRPGLVADASYRQQLEFITVECDFLSEAERERILSGTAREVYLWGE